MEIALFKTLIEYRDSYLVNCYYYIVNMYVNVDLLCILMYFCLFFPNN